MGLGSREIEVFLAIRQHRSLGRAATALNLTQPGVSRILRRLEDQLGAPLFERHPSGVLPTAAGEALLPYAEELASNARSAVDAVASLRGAGASAVRVGTVASVIGAALPKVMQRLLSQDLPIRIELVEDIEDRLSEALANSAIDIAIAGRMEHNVIPLSKTNSFGATLVAVASPTHPLAAHSSLSLSDVTGFRWVLPPTGTPWRAEFCALFKQAGVEPPIAAVETRSIAAIHALVGLTDLLSWQPRSLVSVGAASNPLAEIDVPDLVWRRQFAVYRRRRGILGQGALRFIKALQDVCRDEHLLNMS